MHAKICDCYISHREFRAHSKNGNQKNLRMRDFTTLGGSSHSPPSLYRWGKGSACRDARIQLSLINRLPLSPRRGSSMNGQKPLPSVTRSPIPISSFYTAKIFISVSPQLRKLVHSRGRREKKVITEWYVILCPLMKG